MPPPPPINSLILLSNKKFELRLFSRIIIFVCLELEEMCYFQTFLGILSISVQVGLLNPQFIYIYKPNIDISGLILQEKLDLKILFNMQIFLKIKKIFNTCILLRPHEDVGFSLKGSDRLCKVVELSIQCCGKLLSDSFET